ncbi:hypothetical protein [Mycoplasmopsis sturni]|uniref:hypothetical protein n=1 Tax=Mycoplasmopsis sturni TaxID=39047 RepID=UPI000560A90F|nr:hypothetical protein [Mycoplasmopsis sturni]
MKQLQTKTSKELDLSFDFEILNFENREFDIIIHKLLRNLEYSPKFFEWFMEDLIYFLEQNGYQKRWDIGTIYLSGVENLKLSEANKKEFISFLENFVTNFDIKIKN